MTFKSIKTTDRVKEYFSLSRNKGCNCIYLCQSYFDVPKHIGHYTMCFLLFNGLDARDVQQIAIDHSPGLRKKKDFFKSMHRRQRSLTPVVDPPKDSGRVSCAQYSSHRELALVIDDLVFGRKGLIFFRISFCQIWIYLLS